MRPGDALDLHAASAAGEHSQELLMAIQHNGMGYYDGNSRMINIRQDIQSLNTAEHPYLPNTAYQNIGHNPKLPSGATNFHHYGAFPPGYYPRGEFSNKDYNRMQ